MSKQYVETRRMPGQWAAVKLPLDLGRASRELELLMEDSYADALWDSTLWAIVWPETEGQCLLVALPGVAQTVREEFFQEKGFTGTGEEGFLRRWPFSDGVGLSSAALFQEFMHKRPGALRSDSFDRSNSPPFPQDGSDFQRCVGLLRGAPSWRPRLQAIAKGLSPRWEALVQEWDYLEGLLEGQEFKALYARLQELQKLPSGRPMTART